MDARDQLANYHYCELMQMDNIRVATQQLHPVATQQLHPAALSRRSMAVDLS